MEEFCESFIKCARCRPDGGGRIGVKAVEAEQVAQHRADVVRRLDAQDERSRGHISPYLQRDELEDRAGRVAASTGGGKKILRRGSCPAWAAECSPRLTRLSMHYYSAREVRRGLTTS